jgi:hypothetical protein
MLAYGRVALAFVPLLLAGCGSSSVTQEKFERLKIGMSSQEVQAILGKGGKDVPAEEVSKMLSEALGAKGGGKIDVPNSGAKGVRWGDDKKSITVIYVGDRVSRIFKKGF